MYLYYVIPCLSILVLPFSRHCSKLYPIPWFQVTVTNIIPQFSSFTSQFHILCHSCFVLDNISIFLRYSSTFYTIFLGFQPQLSYHILNYVFIVVFYHSSTFLRHNFPFYTLVACFQLIVIRFIAYFRIIFTGFHQLLIIIYCSS